MGSVMDIKLSSAYSIGLYVVPAIGTPGILGSLRIAAADSFNAKQNSHGERGEPCMVPQPSLKYKDIVPLVCTAA